LFTQQHWLDKGIAKWEEKLPPHPWNWGRWRVEHRDQVQNKVEGRTFNFPTLGIRGEIEDQVGNEGNKHGKADMVEQSSSSSTNKKGKS
jgi:hypothetical protein